MHGQFDKLTGFEKPSQARSAPLLSSPQSVDRNYAACSNQQLLPLVAEWQEYENYRNAKTTEDTDERCSQVHECHFNNKDDYQKDVRLRADNWTTDKAVSADANTFQTVDNISNERCIYRLLSWRPCVFFLHPISCLGYCLKCEVAYRNVGLPVLKWIQGVDIPFPTQQRKDIAVSQSNLWFRFRYFWEGLEGGGVLFIADAGKLHPLSFCKWLYRMLSNQRPRHTTWNRFEVVKNKRILWLICSINLFINQCSLRVQSMSNRWLSHSYLLCLLRCFQGNW